MAKFYGAIGYAQTVETPSGSGIWVDTVIERMHKGDVLRNSRRWQSGDKVNSDLSIGNQISIVADNFAIGNIYAMKYVKYMGVAWTITDVEVQRPRLILTLGGVYNGEQASITN